MKFILITTLLWGLLLTTTATGGTAVRHVGVIRSCPNVVKGVYYYRNATRSWQKKLNVAPTKSAFNASKVRSCRYVMWVAKTWRKRAHVAKKQWQAWLHQQALLRQKLNDPEYAICAVFGRYCEQAKRVAWCEGKYDPNAQNGQYLGTFQMGSKERGIYGHGGTVYEQAKAAYAYFVDSGSNWGPWQCKPW